jgi:MutS domain V
MLDPQNIFLQRATTYQNEANQLKQKANNWTLIRGIVFILAAITTYFIVNSYGFTFAIPVFIVGFGLFLYTVNQHQNILLQFKKANLLVKINETEINRLAGNFNGLADGITFADPKHFYSTDLDLFGPSSIYQLINRTHTQAGGNNLANWLKNAAQKSDILARQSASQELSNLIDFRQNFEMEALLSEKIGQPTEKLLTWIKSEANQKIKKPLFKIASYLPFFTLAVLIGAILGYYSFYFVALMLLIQGIILKQIDEAVSAALEETEIAGDTLKSYAVLLQMIGNQNFTNSKLNDLKNRVNDSPKAIADLDNIIHNLSYRSNPAFAVTGGILMMWDLRFFKKLENWKATHKANLSTWLDVVSDFEAINSLAGFEYANPKYVRPIIVDEAIELVAKQLGHPMIKESHRVCNDIELSGIGKTHIITGSNMSGKSTFERTVGVNLVLALTGAVVCAESFECSIMQVFTSMRTQDSLKDETSSFYAELKRLKQLIEITQPNAQLLPTFYFLDEILKGTNSKDRHIGAKALILQMNKANASGFISTHDVELGDELEGTAFINNFSFSSEVKEGELIFDYKIRKGVCHSFNASDLMRKIGIEI